MLATTSSRPARRPPPLWFVSDGELTVGPVRTELLQRGVRCQRIPEGCWVRELTWRTWRPLEQIREVRAVLRAQGESSRAPDEELELRFALASDAAEVLTFALHECCERTGASFGLVHRAWPGRSEPLTSVVRGLGMTVRLGRAVPAGDPAAQLARVGGLVMGPPGAGLVERAIAARFGAPPDLAGVALLPLGAGRDLLGVIELGRVGHSFRASDTETLARIGDAALAALARR